MDTQIQRMMGTKKGYARISTSRQSFEGQVLALRNGGCECVYEETGSGLATDRPVLRKMLDELHEGDVVVVHALDRLTRLGAVDCLRIIDEISTRDATFRVMTLPVLDTSTPWGRMLIVIFAEVAKLEHSMMLERTKAGLEAAYKARVKTGRMGGRPRALSDLQIEEVEAMLSRGERVSKIAHLMGCSSMTIYRIRDRSDTLSP